MAYIDDPITQRANLDYIKVAMSQPLLERSNEFALAERWRTHNDSKALHELIRSYTRLVISLAARFRNYGLPSGDLIQEGNVGLMQAAARFDPDRDVRFSTYATWWIRSAMQDYVLRNWSIVRTGTTAAQKSLFFNMRRLRAKIEHDGKGMSDEGRQWIADQLKVAFQDVTDMEIRFAAADQSLNAPLRDSSEDEWQDFMPDSAPNPEDVVIGLRDSVTRSKWLADAIGDLSPREQQIIRQRRLEDEGVTLEYLGKELGISKERVRQLEQRAMNKLRVSIMRRVEDRSDLLPAASHWPFGANGAISLSKGGCAMGRQHTYHATVTWTGNRGEGTSSYRAYSRDHLIEVAGKPTIEGSADATFHGDKTRWNPEDLLLGALSACHKLSYLHFAAVFGIVVSEYVDHAEGKMEEDGKDGGRFTEVILRPRITIQPDGDIALATRLHHTAHEKCFIASSVNFPVKCEPVIVAGGPA